MTLESEEGFRKIEDLKMQIVCLSFDNRERQYLTSYFLLLYTHLKPLLITKQNLAKDALTNANVEYNLQLSASKQDNDSLQASLRSEKTTREKYEIDVSFYFYLNSFTQFIVSYYIYIYISSLNISIVCYVIMFN